MKCFIIGAIVGVVLMFAVCATFVTWAALRYGAGEWKARSPCICA